VYERYRDQGIEIVTVAMDLQGASVVRPFVEQAGAQYPTLVDRFNMLGGRFGFKLVPITLLFDEQGRLVRGPTVTDVGKEKDLALIEDWFRNGPTSQVARAGPAAGVVPTAGRAGFINEEAELRFRLAVVLLAQGEKDEAIEHLRRAFALDPENWLIRKQMWAVEHPEKFYDGDVDFGWQREQVKAGR
jgi:hypothetical protein